jgi:SAM-dependent methyltransferase
MLEPLRDRSGLLCDMPSGGGYLAAYVPAGWRYLGVDPAEDFIEACPSGLKRIKSAITDVPLDDSSLDGIVSLAGLHHEPDLVRVFEEMHRLLKRGGRAVLADVAIETSPARFLNGFVDQNNPMGHEGHFLDDRLGGLLEHAGFAVADDQLIEAPWQFDNLEQAGSFCRQLFWMPSLSSEAVAEAMDREIGFDMEDGRPRLRWKLRRIVCDAID